MLSSPSAVRFLASVRSVAEAVKAASNGADIIDCKEPLAGALGALDANIIADIRGAVPAHIPVSATIGDDALSSLDLSDRVARVASTGTDFVKIGFSCQIPWQTALKALHNQDIGKCQLVGVLIADHGVDLTRLHTLAEAGFQGVLLDTEDKNAGALPDVVDAAMLAAFVKTAHDNAMFAGLAGALRARHIADLMVFQPDILGFRGALCHNQGRQNELDASAVTAVRAKIDATQTNMQTNTSKPNTALEVNSL